jgi:hypothetical protein
MPVGNAPVGSYQANGNIHPSVAVKLDTSASPQGGYVLEAGSGDKPIGISQEWQHNPPYPALQDGYAAVATESIRVYGQGEYCWWQTGNTAFNAGTYLKPTTGGLAIPVTAVTDFYIAIAQESSPGDSVTLVRVLVTYPAVHT